jgi:hypothetical protein
VQRRVGRDRVEHALQRGAAALLAPRGECAEHQHAVGAPRRHWRLDPGEAGGRQRAGHRLRERVGDLGERAPGQRVDAGVGDRGQLVGVGIAQHDALRGDPRETGRQAEGEGRQRDRLGGRRTGGDEDCERGRGGEDQASPRRAGTRAGSAFLRGRFGRGTRTARKHLS